MSNEANNIILDRVRTPTGNFDLYDNPNADVLYIDGISHYGLGTAVTKLRCYQSKGPFFEDGVIVEKRQICFDIAMPTPAFIEILTRVLPSLEMNIDALETQSGAFIASLREALKRVK